MIAHARVIVSPEPVEPGDNYGDVCVETVPYSIPWVRYRCDGGHVVQHHTLYDVSFAPPARIVDPPTYFAELIACALLRTEFYYHMREDLGFRTVPPLLSYMRHAGALAAFFDPLPDPRLVLSVTVRSYQGRLQDVRIQTCVGYASTNYAYARDVFVRVHRDLVSRSDTRVSLAMHLSRLGPFGIDARELRKIEQVLAPLNTQPWSHYVNQRTETRRGTVIHLSVHVESTVATAHLWQELRQRVARATSSRIVQHRMSLPGYRFGYGWWRGHRFGYSVSAHPLSTISWQSVFPHALDVALALAPLRLPPYVVVWILQWIPEFGTQRELRLLRLVENVTRRCAALVGHRLACAGKGLRKRAQQ